MKQEGLPHQLILDAEKGSNSQVSLEPVSMRAVLASTKACFLNITFLIWFSKILLSRPFYVEQMIS